MNVISENMTGNDFTVQEGPSPTEGEDEPEIMEQQIRDTPNMSATEGPAHRELENLVIKITTPIQCVKKVIVPAFSKMSVRVSANVSERKAGAVVAPGRLVKTPEITLTPNQCQGQQRTLY